MTIHRAVLAIAVAVLAMTCGSTAATDRNFDSSVGADYVPPPADASADAVDAGAVN
jgi:hypothetical protein